MIQVDATTTKPGPMARMMARMMLLERAAGLLGGQEKLAEAIGIKGRSLRMKFTADRGVSDHDLEMTALALDARAIEIAGEAAKIRKVVADGR